MIQRLAKLLIIYTSILLLIITCQPVLAGQPVCSAVLAQLQSQEFLRSISTVIDGVDIEYTDLNYVKRSLSGRAANVDEGRYIVLDQRESRELEVMYTQDIRSCAAVVIRDRVSGTVLLSHFVTLDWEYSDVAEIHAYVARLERAFALKGGALSSSDITIAWGRSRQEDYPDRIKNLIESLKAKVPQSLRLDSTHEKRESTIKLNVYVDLSTGQIFKKDPSGGRHGVLDASEYQQNHPQNRNGLSNYRDI